MFIFESAAKCRQALDRKSIQFILYNKRREIAIERGNFLTLSCRFTIDVLQMIKKYTVTPFCVIVKVPPKTIDRRNRI